MFARTNLPGVLLWVSAVILNGCMTPVDNDAVVVNESTPAANENATSWTEKLAQGVRLDCQTPGCLRSVMYVGAWTREELEPYQESNQTIDNGYHLWQVYFATQNRYAGATIAIPDVDTDDPEGFAVVVNNPGTVGVATLCAPGYSSYGAGLASTFGARGYVGVSVDYPGLGSEGTHPYLLKESEGKASLDALRATRALMVILDIPLKDKDAVVGLSQGGHATFAAAELHASYAPELPIKGFGAVAPGAGYAEHWIYAQYPGTHLSFYALINYAWHEYYGYDDTDSWAEGKRDDMVALLTSKCLYSMEGDGLYDLMPVEPTEIFSSALIDAFTYSDFSSFPAIAQGFADSRLAGFETDASLRLFQGTADELVPQIASEALVSDLNEDGTGVELILIENATHTDTCFGPLGYTQLGNPMCFAWLDDILGP